MPTKLAEMQRKIKAPKNQRNNFGNYNYRSAEDILEAVKSCLAEDDVFNITADVVAVGDRYYVKSTAMFNGVSSVAFAREQVQKKGMDEAQITGAATSYANKYAMGMLFALDDTKDADSQDNTGEGVKKEEPPHKRAIKAIEAAKTIEDVEKTYKYYVDKYWQDAAKEENDELHNAYSLTKLRFEGAIV